MKMDMRVSRDLQGLSHAALNELLRLENEAIAHRGRFAVALSGGHTPATLHRLWADSANRGHKSHWERVHLFWGDDRYVPHDDPMSNYRMARETLIEYVPIPAANVHPMPTDFPQPEDAAKAYEAELRAFFGAAPPAFDLQIMGIGVEGHTASLFPGSPLLGEKQRWVAAVVAPAKPPRRLTLTPVVLDQGRNTFFLVAGADKREIIAALRNQPDNKTSHYPVARIHPTGPVLWFLDEAAAGLSAGLSAGGP